MAAAAAQRLVDAAAARALGRTCKLTVSQAEIRCDAGMGATVIWALLRTYPPQAFGTLWLTEPMSQPHGCIGGRVAKSIEVTPHRAHQVVPWSE